MHIKVTLTKTDVEELVLKHLEEVIGGSFSREYMQIETKSKQNFESEWEQADCRVTYEGPIS